MLLRHMCVRSPSLIARCKNWSIILSHRMLVADAPEMSIQGLHMLAGVLCVFVYVCVGEGRGYDHIMR